MVKTLKYTLNCKKFVESQIAAQYPIRHIAFVVVM